MFSLRVLRPQVLAALSDDGDAGTSAKISKADLDRILEVMDATVSSAVAQEATCNRLGDLLANADNHSLMIEVGCIRRISRAMLMHAAAAGVQVPIVRFTCFGE